MSRRMPWYKRDVDAWRGGTRGMSIELRGFYSECLDAMWDVQGPIPDDVEKLAVMFCCNPRTVRKLLPQLVGLGKVVLTAEGYLNPRMMNDLGRAVPVPIQAGLDADQKPARAEFDANSSAFAAEFDAKIPKNPMNSTRDFRREIQKEEEEPRGMRARDDVLITDGRIEIGPFTAAELTAEFPHCDVASVAIRAAPELVKFRRPSLGDKLAVLRRSAMFDACARQRAARSTAKPSGNGKQSVLDYIRSQQ
jgi:uncharacterized protein YdaU (DUF1376 family)